MTMYLPYKTLHFVKIVTISWGVFDKFLFEISPFVLFQFMSKNSAFDDVPPIKNVTFCENYRCSIRGFCSISVWNLTCSSIFLQKTSKKWRCTSHKKRYILWKLSLFHKGFLINFCLKSHLSFFFNLCENLTLFFFLTKNNNKNDDVPIIKKIRY